MWLSLGDSLPAIVEVKVAARTRRGVMITDRQVREPMLDAGKERQYAPGSLLKRVGRQEEGSQPKSRRKERSLQLRAKVPRQRSNSKKVGSITSNLAALDANQ